MKCANVFAERNDLNQRSMEIIEIFMRSCMPAVLDDMQPFLTTCI